MLTILVIFILVLIFIWLAGYIYRTDLHMPTTSFSEVKKVLAIFPHPDDEVLTAGGLLNKKSSVLYLLTKGEKGTVSGSLNSELASIRSMEVKRVTKILGINKLIQDDFEDGELDSNKTKLTKRIKEVISKENPNCIVTYDLSGLYGHQDHIVCSEVVTELVKKKFPSIKLLYTTQPTKILKLASLPEHMARDKNFLSKRTAPTVKFFVGSAIINKIQAVYAYESQYHSFRSAFPSKFIPLWFLISTSLHEYFFEAN